MSLISIYVGIMAALVMAGGAGMILFTNWFKQFYANMVKSPLLGNEKLLLGTKLVFNLPIIYLLIRALSVEQGNPWFWLLGLLYFGAIASGIYMFVNPGQVKKIIEGFLSLSDMIFRAMGIAAILIGVVLLTLAQGGY